MIIGVPKEIKEQEHRVALLPSTATTLTRRGHTVLVQKSAGFGSGFSDDDYVAAGAQIIDTAEEVFRQAEMIVKVKEPIPEEYPLLEPGNVLFTYLHLAADAPLAQALIDNRVTAIAYETVQLP
ncbi:MAG: alanine dehydrogenase, partial [Verrucomicrobiota bacterium]|nr:alanine dehydrogenase [Verrucomicrobiota bacterium]